VFPLSLVLWCDMLTILAVITRIATNPLSNVSQKQLAQRSAEPLFIIAAIYALLTALALPFLLAKPPQRQFYESA
jgi:hypothetical protein